MSTTLIVLVLAAIAVGIVVWATRRKPSATTTAPREADTAWNDPVTPGAPARPAPRAETHTDALPPEDPRP